MSDPYGDVRIDAVNAWEDDDGSVVVALRHQGDDEFTTYRLPRDVADQLWGMVYLLTKETGDD